MIIYSPLTHSYNIIWATGKVFDETIYSLHPPLPPQIRNWKQAKLKSRSLGKQYSNPLEMGFSRLEDRCPLLFLFFVLLFVVFVRLGFFVVVLFCFSEYDTKRRISFGLNHPTFDLLPTPMTESMV
jgi:hypothetical protein